MRRAEKTPLIYIRAREEELFRDLYRNRIIDLIYIYARAKKSTEQDVSNQTKKTKKIEGKAGSVLGFFVTSRPKVKKSSKNLTK